MATDPKPPYKVTITLKGAKPEHVTAALAELSERAAEYDQSGETSATMTIEAFREDILMTVVNAFETWLFYQGSAECDIKLVRPGLRPETAAMLAREKNRTPMDAEWQAFADKNHTSVTGTLFGRPINVMPNDDDEAVSSDMPPARAR
jgi:hypothetical protein